MKIKKKQFSIILPCFNSEKTIKRTLESIERQTYQNFNIIAVDDGSNDQTQQILHDFKDRVGKISVVEHLTNMGEAEARNTALKLADGQFIAFIDADDCWTEDKLSTFYDHFKKGFDLLYSNYLLISAANKREIRVPVVVSFEKLLRGNAIPLSSAAYDQTKLKKVFFKRLPKSEDYCMWLEMMKKVRNPYGIQKILMHYYVGQSNTSKNKLKMLYANWIIFRIELKLGFFKSLYLIINYILYGIRKHYL